METFAYVMAGLMVLTTIVTGIFKHFRDKWSNIATYYAVQKTMFYNALASISAFLVIFELIILFIGAIICGFIKLIG